jgi:FtsZ-binding cell division protein ZapB
MILEASQMRASVSTLKERNISLSADLSDAKESIESLEKSISDLRKYRDGQNVLVYEVLRRLADRQSVLVETGRSGFPPNSRILACKSDKTSWLDEVKTKSVERIKKVWHRTKWFFSLLGSLVLGALKRHTWSKTQVVEGTNLFLSGIPFFAKPAENTKYISLTEKFEYRFLNEKMRNAVVPVPVKDFESITRDQIDTAVQEIETALKDGKEVVLFSKAGVRRSAAVAIAYLMKKNNQQGKTTDDKYGEALNQITASRPQTHIDWKTKNEIKAFFESLPEKKP